MMVYCCMEHVEQALDEVVKAHEVPPVFEKVESVENSQFSCEYCGQLAIYIVGNE